MDRTLNILVADDVEINRLVVRRILEKAGLHVLETCNGNQTLEVLESQEIHIALLDVMMPDVDGLTICRRIRKRHAPNELPVLFITAKVEDIDLAEGFAAGGNDYITKPINSTVLLARLNAQIELLQANRALSESHARLAERKRMETLGVFASGIAHNFNNLLGTVLGSAELIQLCTEQGSEIHSAAELIVGAAKRGAVFVDGLMSFTQPSEHQICFSPAEIVASSLALLPSIVDSEIAFQMELDHELPALNIAPDDLAHVLIELLKNAAEAIPKQGTITVAARRGSPSTAIPCVDFRITDTGSGISPNLIDHVFEPFYSSKNVDQSSGISLDGSGLGLSTAYNIVKHIGGNIRITDTSSSGTTVELTIPIVAAE